MKVKSFFIGIFILSNFLSSCAVEEAANNDEADKIKSVLVSAYVEGIHMNRDSVAVRKGFHPDFVMKVYADDQMIHASLDMWLDRMKLDGVKNPKKIEHECGSIDVTGNAATAKMEIFIDSKHVYTDYFLLYNFEDGWKIVGKIFYSHPE